MNDDDPKSFEDAGEKPATGIAAEVLALLKHNRKWWLIPIIIVLLIFGTILILGGTSAAPFIYSLF